MFQNDTGGHGKMAEKDYSRYLIKEPLAFNIFPPYKPRLLFDSKNHFPEMNFGIRYTYLNQAIAMEHPHAHDFDQLGCVMGPPWDLRLYDAETERNFSSQNTQPEAAVIYDPLRTDPYREYFILENRNQPLLVDRGMALWLINEEGPNWPSGLNSRKVVRLVRRGGHWANMDQALWDGVNDTDGYDITATSTPRNTSWTDGTPSYIEIYDISQSGPTMTFKVEIPPIFVDWTNSGTESGTQANPHNTLAEAINAIPTAPRTIRISGGTYPENTVINTPCTLKGWRNGNAVIGQ